MRLRDRLSRLEQATVCGTKRWHRIIVYADQTKEQAIALYEQTNGPMGPDDGSILRVIINKSIPTPRAA